MDAMQALAAAGPSAFSALDTVAEPGKREQATAVARQFEEVFVRMMLQEMRKSTGTDQEGSLFGSGPGSSTYEDWFDTHLSEHLTSDRGIGLAEVMMEQWQRSGHVPAEASQGEENHDDE